MRVGAYATSPAPDRDLVRQREVVDAFLAAARTGDFDALLAILDPDVVIRADRGTLRVVRGARAVAEGALAFSRLVESARVALVNGTPGIVSWAGGHPMSVIAVQRRAREDCEIDILADPVCLARLDLTVVHD